MTALTLRPYQTEAVDAVWNSLAREDGNWLGVLPTGTGKALCIAEFIRRALADYPQTRILVLTHSRELVAQNYAEMMGLWPACPAGIYAAGLNRRDIRAQVIFGSIQSLHRKAYDLQNVDLVLVDEAQSIPRTADTMWRKFLGELLQINPYLRCVGWTATAYRLDSGMLHKGPSALFSGIAYEYNVRDAIEAGYLCPPVSTAAATQIDTTDVGIRGGECGLTGPRAWHMDLLPHDRAPTEAEVAAWRAALAHEDELGAAGEPSSDPETPRCLT